MKEQQFLELLQKEAQRQAKLEETLILPSSLNDLASFFVAHMWKILLVLAAILALIRISCL